VTITKDATHREIGFLRLAPMLPGDDVIDDKEVFGKRLPQTAILTNLPRPPPHKPFKRR